MYHHGQRVKIIINEQNRLCYPRDYFIVLTAEEVARFYPRAKPAVVVTANPYHNHQLQKMTTEERVAEFKKGFLTCKFNMMSYFTRLVIPIDPCKNENLINKLERIDD